MREWGDMHVRMGRQACEFGETGMRGWGDMHEHLGRQAQEDAETGA